MLCIHELRIHIYIRTVYNHYCGLVIRNCIVGRDCKYVAIIIFLLFFILDYKYIYKSFIYAKVFLLRFLIER